MSPRVRLLVLDIDGTLLTSAKRIAPRTRAAIAAARARGVLVILATGRRYPSALPVARDLGGDPPLILHNGALVLERGLILRCRPLPRAVARRAIAVGRGLGCDFVVHCGQRGEGRLLVEAGARRDGLLGYYLERSREDVVLVRDADALEEDPMQVMFGGPPEQMQRLLPALTAQLSPEARIERTVYPRGGVAILDVLEASVGKAAAVALFQARLKVSVSETLAIGDNWNDREMLLGAGQGLVMGGAAEELRELGLPVLPSADEDGVAVAIEQYVL